MKYKNRATGVTVDVRDDKVLGGDWERLGGAKTKAAAKSQPAGEGSNAPPPGPDLYDPATDNAAAVVARLDATSDEAERSRILEAEAAGKNRKTVLAWEPAPAGE